MVNPNPSFLSKRVKKRSQIGLTSDRYQYLGLDQAEPDLGDPLVGPSSVGVNPYLSNIPDAYVLVSDVDKSGNRYWIKQTELLSYSNLTGDIISIGTATSIASEVIVNADISPSAAIVDTKLATISTSGKVLNSATTATSSNSNNAIVSRNGSGGFVAGIVTASSFTGSGANLTTLNASNISSGTLNNARLPQDISVSGITTASRFVSTATTGTSPLTVTSTTLVTNLNADLLDGQHGSYYNDLTNATGTLADARLIGTYTGISINTTGIVTASSFTGSGANLTALNASNLSSGTLPDARLSGTYTGISINTTGIITATSFTGSGANLTSLNASNISSGTLNNARLPQSISVSGIITSTQFSTGASGTGINITNNTITGPAELTIDPAGVGDNTGSVRIRGNLFVDGTETFINSTTIELADFNVGIATTVGTNALLDGAGIGIGSVGIRKQLTWNNASTSLKSSENFDIATGKTYKINGTNVLSSTTLGSSIINSSLTSVGTLGQLNVSGIATVNQLDVNQLSPDGIDYGTTSYVPVANGTGGWSWKTVTSAGAGNLNGIDVRDEGVLVGTAGSVTSIDFRGINIIATAPVGGAIATITVSDTPTFDSLVVSGVSTSSRFVSTTTTGTSPLTVASTTLVSNLNADLLDGQQGSYYNDLTNATGTLADARLPDLITSNINITSGVSTFATVKATTFEGTLNGNASSATYANSSGVSTYATSSGIASALTSNASINTTGIITASSFTGSGANLTSLNASQLTSGTVPNARLSGTYTGISINTTGIITATSFTGSGANLTSLNASQITSGTIQDGILSGTYTGISLNTTGTITASSFTGSGVGLTSLNAGNISSGTINDARLPQDISVSGIITSTQFSTGALGTGINITNNTISGPSEITIDPAAVGDNTGAVRIKGDLYIDGTQTYINSSTIELADFNVGIATTVGTNSILDGAGIGIGSTNIRKTITWSNASTSLKSSENIDITIGKTYKIDGIDVLSSTTLGSSIINSSLTSVGTLGQLNVSGIITSNSINIGLDIGISTTRTTISTTSETTIDSFSTLTFRSAKIQVQITQGTDYQISDLLVIHDGIDASLVECGSIATNQYLGNFSTIVSGNSCLVQVSMNSSIEATIKILSQRFTI